MAFSISSYSLKYYKEFTNLRKDRVRLEIYEKGASLSSDYPMEIGELNGLALEVEGRSESIDVPIVKSTLTFSMVDTSDMPNEYIPDTWNPNTGEPTSSHIRKHGNWQEFYTPDATKYLVRVYTSRYATMMLRWQGYITPDSWEESLAYRGTVTITARDGLGALSELAFDMSADSNGMVKARTLVEAAFSKANIPMELYIGESHNTYDGVLQDSDGMKVLDVVMNRSAFEDMSWYDALEAVLNSLGQALRFSDPNGFVLIPLRYLPHLNYGEEIGPLEDLECDMQFYSGTKMLDPAYKSIVEKIDFGFDADKEIIASDYNTIFRDDETPSYTFRHLYYVDSHNNYYLQSTAALHASMAYGDDGAWDPGSYPSYLDASRYQILQETLDMEGDDCKKYVFAAANSYDSNRPPLPTFKKRMQSSFCKLTLEFAPNPATVYNENGSYNDWTGYNGGRLAVMSAYRTKRITYYIRYQNNISFAASTAYRYWNGSGWQSSAPSTNLYKEWDVFNEAASSMELYLADCPDVGKNGYLVIGLMGIEMHMYYPYSESLLYRSRGVFFRIKSVRFESQIKQNIESHTTTTNNQLNTACNVRLERNPKFGFLPQDVAMLFADSYKYAFFCYKNGVLQPAPYKWRWANTGTLQPFPALVAKQLLCYHAASEEILEGDCSPESPSYPSEFHCIFMYKTVGHMMQGGTLDFREGRFVSASIRSFKLYEDLFSN